MICKLDICPLQGFCVLRGRAGLKPPRLYNKASAEAEMRDSQPEGLRNISLVHSWPGLCEDIDFLLSENAKALPTRQMSCGTYHQLTACPVLMASMCWAMSARSPLVADMGKSTSDCHGFVYSREHSEIGKEG